MSHQIHGVPVSGAPAGTTVTSSAVTSRKNRTKQCEEWSGGRLAAHELALQVEGGRAGLENGLAYCIEHEGLQGV